MKPPLSFPITPTRRFPPSLALLTTLGLRKLRSLAHELLRDWQSGHDVQLDGLLAAQELDLFGHLESESAVEFQIERVAAFEVAGTVFHVRLVASSIQYLFRARTEEEQRKSKTRYYFRLEWSVYLLGGIFNQTLCVPFAPRARSCANVNEVPGVVVVGAEDVVFGVVQQGEELVEETLLAFFGELPVEAVHAAPEHGAEIVHVLLGGHPVSLEGRVSRLFGRFLTYLRPSRLGIPARG